VAIKNYFRSTNSWAKHAAVIALFGAMGALLGSCGGQGAAPTTATGGVLQILPGTAIIFPGAPTAFSVSGGDGRYTLFSDNTSVIATPVIASGNFTVTANPVVADTSVTITVRDGVGATAGVTLSVKANVLNNIVTITPIAPTGTGCGGLCSGGDAQVVVKAVLNGLVLRNRPIKFDVFQGDFRFVTPVGYATPPGPNTQVTSVTINTDENGEAVAKLTAIVTAPTQVATLTTTDTISGLVRYANFNIVQATSGTGILSVLPSGSVTFTGAKPLAGQPAQCPFGAVVDMYIYGGSPPYSIVSPLPQYLSVFPPIVTTNGGSFRVTQNGCGTASLIVTDAQNRAVETSSVVSVLGPAGDAPPPVVAASVTPSPTAHTLSCGQTATSTLTGSGTYTATVTTPGVPAGTFTVAPTVGAVPGTISFTRNAPSAALPIGTIIVNLVAGSAAAQAVTITIPLAAQAACP
jgi:hypothetical protein